MTSDNQTIDLILEIADSEAGTDVRDRDTYQLRDEVRQLDVESVEMVPAESIPEGAKPLDPATIGALAVKLIPAAIPKLVGFVKEWAGRKDGRQVTIKANVAGNTLDVAYIAGSLSADELQQTLTQIVTLLNVKPATAS